ncbi:MAG: HypC/HybG/HupF family hydrogenase formation chaperone [Bacteroidota bacterium]|nr:HypC/HybG/HupF family hydrogenase formation chaperone [Bacteroidota bacterium]
MCLAIPGKIVSIDHSREGVTGTVDFAGTRKTVNLEWVPEANVGDYVMVHVGFALSVVDEQEALETLELLRHMESVGSEPGDPEDTP